MSHPLLWMEEFAFYTKASAAGLWAHMRNGLFKGLSEESAGLWILTGLVFSCMRQQEQRASHVPERNPSGIKGILISIFQTLGGSDSRQGGR